MGFPEQLKKARLKIGFTQEQVAERMGITKSTYCGYETGKRQPDVAKIKQLTHILNTSGDILLETGLGADAPECGSEVLKELYGIAKGLSEDEQLYLLDMIKALKQRLGSTPLRWLH